MRMRKSLVARILTLLAGVLFCLGPSVLAQENPFLITLDKAHPTVKTNVASGAGPWHFVVTVVRGKVNSLGLHIKDDGFGSGDICWLTSFRNPKGQLIFDTEDVPAATVDACGPNFPDENEDPLTLVAGIQTGDAKAMVVIEVTYPASPVALNHSVGETASRSIVPIAFREVWALRRSLRS